jgi:hypothetical protein
MGSIMSAIYDDMDRYENLCEHLGVKEKSLGEMYNHMSYLEKTYGYERTYFGHQKIKDKNKKK